MDQLFFLFQYLFNELLMIVAQIFNVAAILSFQLGFRLDTRLQRMHLDCLDGLRLACSLSCSTPRCI